MQSTRLKIEIDWKKLDIRQHNTTNPQTPADLHESQQIMQTLPSSPQLIELFATYTQRWHYLSPSHLTTYLSASYSHRTEIMSHQTPTVLAHEI